MEKTNSMADLATSRWGWAASVIACVLIVLVLTPFTPEMPIAGVDGSWAYAMNIATAEHMRFGKDVIFTFGPLASVYTGVYHPATDALMIGGSLLISAAMFAGLFAATDPRRRVLLPLVPLCIGLAWLPDWDGWRDAVLMLLPLLLPFVVVRGNETGRQSTATICLLAAAIGILPLVKGNFSLIAAAASLVAVILCWPTSRRLAIGIVVIEIVALIAAWLIAGQALMDLPGYFIAQLPIISGYTDGMSTSVDGRLWDLAIFIIVGAVMVGVSALGGLRTRWYAPILVALYLFVTFKSGFVRHDPPHAFIASSALLLMGLLLCLMPGSQHGRGAVALGAGMLGWVLIAFGILPPDPLASVARVGDAIRIPAHGVWQRVTDAGALERQYQRRLALLANRPPFANQHGQADVYPWDLSPLLASGMTWKPRPILQSYAAFAPSLIKANADHLKADPPSRIYFGINPIDQRYPAMEDGASWLDLLGSFRPEALDGGYAVLEHRASAGAALQPGPAVQVAAHLGERVAVPGWEHPVWASIDIRPTLPGKLFATLYKAPELSLEVIYEDGSKSLYRMIAGMGRPGFLLSPTVTDANQFVALGSHSRDDLLGKRRVVAFGVRGQSGTRLMWQSDYQVTFARLDIPTTVDADVALSGPWKDGLSVGSYPVGGNCNIEDVDGTAVTGAAMELPGRMLFIRGWAALDGEKGKLGQATSLLAEGHDGRTVLLPVHRVSRPDVSNYFHRPSLEYAGFHAFVDLRRLPENVQIRVLQDDGSHSLVCQPALLTLHRTDAVTPLPAQ
jgi:hypothetical protein